MTELNKVIRRVTVTRTHEKSKSRAFVVSLEPGDMVGTRLQGTRQTYRLHVQQIYRLAVENWLAQVEKRAKQLRKDSPMRMSTARSRAHKELAKELKA